MFQNAASIPKVSIQFDENKNAGRFQEMWKQARAELGQAQYKIG